MKTLHALIVAIDKYPNPAHQLNGCVNDAKAFSKYLKDYCATNGLTFNEKRLFDEAAKRLEIVKSFEHFDAAQDGDICAYYYSGHGSQMRAPKEFWDEADNMSETIVCWDSRTQMPDARDLADKEIGYLIHKATTGKNLHFLVITDCCHSGSNTRDAAIKARMVETCLSVPRGVEDYVGYKEYVKFQPPASHHMHLAAAKDDETAKELKIGGTPRGVFTYSLIETLNQAGGFISYRELMSRVGLKCRNRVAEQTPQLNAYVATADASLSFLGETQPREGIFTVGFDNTEGWTVNMGGAQGMPSSGAVFKLENGLTVETTAVKGNFSKIKGIEQLPQTQQFRATLEKINLPAMRLGISKDSEEQAIEAIKIAFSAGIESVELIDSEQDVDYLIRAWDNTLRLTKLDNTVPLFRRVRDYTPQSVQTFIARVLSVVQWQRRLEITNPTTTLSDASVEILFYNATGQINTNRVFRQNDAQTEAVMQVSITNRHTKPLWVSAVYFGADFTISNQFLRHKFLKPNETAWIEFENDRNIPLSIQAEYRTWGVNELTEYFKFFVSTDEINTDIHNQDGLPLDEKTRTDRAIVRVATAIPLSDWRTFERSFQLVCPAQSVPLAAKRRVSLGAIEILAPEGFTAQASLSSTLEAKRAIADLPTLRGLPDLSSAALTEGIGASVPMDVLELEDISGTVSASNPLIINLSESSDDELVIPFGYDAISGLFLPLGASDTEGVISIGHLPAAHATTRSAVGASVKLFFKKVFVKPFASERYKYPMLRMVNFDKTSLTDHFTYGENIEEIKKAIAEPSISRVVLFVHGFLNNSSEAPKALRRPLNQERALIHPDYDLVLTFDYENMNTPVEETAKALEKKLAEIGLKKGCNKQFEIIAQSMGGMVSRYFIECLSGKEFVKHLTMLGTPNNGSEVADLKAQVEALLGMAVNGASWLQPYLMPLGWLGKFLNKMFVTIEQQRPNSPFFQTLNSAPDAGVPYHIIYGNTELMKEKMPEHYGFIKKFLTTLKKRKAYAFADWYFAEPNDMVVRAASASKPGNQRNVTLTEVASDHFSYILPESEGLRALNTAVERAAALV